jgi:hypothetical protein
VIDFDGIEELKIVKDLVAVAVLGEFSKTVERMEGGSLDVTMLETKESMEPWTKDDDSEGVLSCEAVSVTVDGGGDIPVMLIAEEDRVVYVSEAVVKVFTELAMLAADVPANVGSTVSDDDGTELKSAMAYVDVNAIIKDPLSATP